MDPYVSVIIPCYNNEEYLRECVESALSQTLKNIEIICIDDGSTDSSSAIMDEYANQTQNARVIKKPNAGFGQTINTGIDAAKGKYLAILESDDYVEPLMYETLFQKARDLGFPDMIRCDFRRFYGEGANRTFDEAPLSTNPDLSNTLINPQKDLRFFELYNLMQPGIYSLDMIRKFNIRLNESPGASYQDNGFWFQTHTNATSAYYLPESFYNLRRDNPNSSIKSTGKVYAMCGEYDFIREKLIEGKERFHPDILKLCARKRFDNYEGTCNRIDPSFRREFIYRWKSDYEKLLAAGEAEERFFEPWQWVWLNTILNDPDRYYYEHEYWQPESERLWSRIHELEAENASLREELNGAYNSTSLKVGLAVTAPLRAVKRKLGK